MVEPGDGRGMPLPEAGPKHSQGEGPVLRISSYHTTDVVEWYVLGRTADTRDGPALKLTLWKTRQQ